MLILIVGIAQDCSESVNLQGQKRWEVEKILGKEIVSGWPLLLSYQENFIDVTL